MIALVDQKRHSDQFDACFAELFANLSQFARSRGIDGCHELGGTSSGEDPEDFAQECLIEYFNRSRREGFCDVQTALVKRIARDRLIDIWRKRGRRPDRLESDFLTEQYVVGVDSFDDCGEPLTIPEFQGLSPRATEILWLKYVSEWLDREIADAMGMTVDGVRSSLKRSRQKLVTKRVKEAQ
ncbi:MAG: RNA polymerase sigma factor [Candidatus Paceibacterota bacterium]